MKHLPEADLADTAARTDGVIWVHLDHSDEHGMALLVEKINPRRDDLRDVNNRTPVPKLHVYWTVVAGICGMNFSNMPELGWSFGYPAALTLMLVLGGVLWYLFRRQHWL